MRYLAHKGIEVTSRNQNGSNALHMAVKQQNLQVLKVLLEIKFPLNYTKNNGVTALGIAAFKGNLAILDMLYKAGAEINITSRNGAGPLYLAVK